jgi:transcription-repair coupling factor (superfamily II helicase)
MLAEAVEGEKAQREGRAPVIAAPSAVIDLPMDAHLPDEYVADEAPKLELYRRLAYARSDDDIAEFRSEVADRFGPMPDPVERLVEVAELRLAAEAAGVLSISRESGWLIIRFGATVSRSMAMRLLGDGGLPGVHPSDITFASNQVRVRAPTPPGRAWELTRSIVARLLDGSAEPA